MLISCLMFIQYTKQLSIKNIRKNKALVLFVMINYFCSKKQKEHMYYETQKITNIFYFFITVVVD